MKINKQQLQTALETVKPGLANKEMIEQTTSFVFIKGKVVTYNDEISISHPLPGINFDAAIRAEELYKFLGKMKEEEIKIIIKDSELQLQSGRAKAWFTLQQEIKLPIQDEIGEVGEWKPLPESFLQGLKYAMGACGNDMINPKMTCVHVSEEFVEGADNPKICRFNLTKKQPVGPFLLPAANCEKVLKLNPVKIAKGDGWVHFLTEEGTQISCRIYKEDYPDTSPYLNAEGSTLKFPDTIIDMVDRAEVFAKRDYVLDESITIDIKDKVLKVTSEGEGNIGWYEEKEKIETEEEISFVVAPYLIKDILKETKECIIGNNKVWFEGDNWKYVAVLKIKNR